MIVRFGTACVSRITEMLVSYRRATTIAGIRCLLVHAKDDAARQCYEAWEIERSPTDPYHLLLMLKDLKGMSSK